MTISTVVGSTRWVVDAQPPLTAEERLTMTREERHERSMRIKQACYSAGIKVRTYFSREANARMYAEQFVAPVVEPLGIEPLVTETMPVGFA